MDQQAKHDFEEIFELELECWCYGLKQIKDEVHPTVMHRVLSEFASVCNEAIRREYPFSIVATAQRFSLAAKDRIVEKEIAFKILSSLPTPNRLLGKQEQTLLQIVDQAERYYGGAYDRLQRKWKSAPSPTGALQAALAK